MASDVVFEAIMLRQLAVISLSVMLVAGCSSNYERKKDQYDRQSAAEIYSKAISRLEDKRYENAVEDFDALEARYPYGNYADKAQLAVIYAYFEGDEPEAALAAAERFIQIHPRHEHVDYAYYMKGLIKFSDSLSSFYRYLPLHQSERDITPAREAFFHFDELIKRFPESQYANDARQRMRFLKTEMAHHDYLVAEHYFSRKAYVAALDRATTVVEQFSDTRWSREALEIMHASYEALGLHDLAHDTQRIIELNAT